MVITLQDLKCSAIIVQSSLKTNLSKMDPAQQKWNRHFLRKEEAGSPLIIIFSFCQERILFWSKTDINIFDIPFIGRRFECILGPKMGTKQSIFCRKCISNCIFSCNLYIQLQIVYLAVNCIFSCKLYIWLQIVYLAANCILG